VDQIRTVGRYRIDEWLASGAMGEVYRGFDPVIDRPVAIKIVRRELSAGTKAQDWLERFRREARAAGRRFHPNIVTILDYGEEGARPFLVMEFVDGQSLDALLRSSGVLAPGNAATIIIQLLSALGFSHENGVVHRDIKPSNVLIRENQQVKLADFGIARIDDSELTMVGDILGTPAYMAPEQLAGAPVDHRTDLFAAGVMLFEMLTCIKPFRGKSITEIISHMERRGPEDVCALNPGVPEALRTVINTALAFDPAQRYETAAAFSRAVAAAVTPEQDAATIVATAEQIPVTVRAAQSAEKSTAALQEETARWDPSAMRAVEADLAVSIGPIAAIAVRRAARDATSLERLYEALSLYIENSKERADFLAKAQRTHSAAPNRTSPPQPEQPTPVRQSPGVLPEVGVLEAIELNLARYTGPIARILLKRELESFKDLPGLYHALARHISDDSERSAFLKTGGYG